MIRDGLLLLLEALISFWIVIQEMGKWTFWTHNNTYFVVIMAF